MSTLSPVIGALACPPGMFAIGGVAWAVGKLRRGERSQLGRGAGMTMCNPLAALSRRGGRGEPQRAGDDSALAS